jgi:hypothetical protein
MSSLTLVLLLGMACLFAGVISGALTGHRVLRDAPVAAMIGGGIVVAVFGFFALVSYLGFVFYPLGLYFVGFGVGSGVRRLWPAAR